MQEKYIMPVVGQVYTNRNGNVYRCINNTTYPDDAAMQKAVELGEHCSCMVRLTDGWTIEVHGVFRYEDETIEWRFSTDGAFLHESLARCWKNFGTDMYKYFDYLEQLRDSGEANMFGAAPYLQRKFLDLSTDRDKAKSVLQAWMDSYKDRCEEGKD